MHHAGIIDVCGKCLRTASNYIKKAYKMPVEKQDETAEEKADAAPVEEPELEKV